jgi:phosphotriesterase-related protein
MIGEGHLNQVLISHDTALKTMLASYGGVGYAHIPKNVVPLMKAKGISEEQIHTITIENPKRMLTIA